MNKQNEIDGSDVNTKASAPKAEQGDDADRADKPDPAKDSMKQAIVPPNTVAAKGYPPLLKFPAEIRNMIYDMVIEDAPDTLNRNHPVGESTLRQPALAKVNRQLRSEVLPLWYKERFFGICVYPKRHSEADQVWQDFVDRFKAHTDGANGSHYLSRITRLQLELWHPALDPGFLPDPDTIPDTIPDLIHTKKSHRIYQQTGLLSYDMCNGVYLRLGDVYWSGCSSSGDKWSGGHRVGDKDTNWTDRGAVRALLEAGIVEERGDRYPDRLERFWRTFPFERLVDFLMLIAEECKEAARSVHIKTSFAPLCVTVRPESPPPDIDDDWAGATAPGEN